MISPNGPWEVADYRPQQVASILPSSPVYNVKHVHVYHSTPDVVYVGYTPGYYGSYVHNNTLFYGTGWPYSPWISPYYYYPRHRTWGWSVSYNSWSGWNFGLSWGWGWNQFGFWSGGYWHHHQPWYHRHYGYWGPRGYWPRHHVRNHHGYRRHDHYGRRHGYRDRYDRRGGRHGPSGYDRYGYTQAGYTDDPARVDARDQGQRNDPPRRTDDNLYRSPNQQALIADMRDGLRRRPGDATRSDGDQRLGYREPTSTGSSKSKKPDVVGSTLQPVTGRQTLIADTSDRLRRTPGNRQSPDGDRRLSYRQPTSSGRSKSKQPDVIADTLLPSRQVRSPSSERKQSPKSPSRTTPVRSDRQFAGSRRADPDNRRGPVQTRPPTQQVRSPSRDRKQNTKAPSRTTPVGGNRQFAGTSRSDPDMNRAPGRTRPNVNSTPRQRTPDNTPIPVPDSLVRNRRPSSNAPPTRQSYGPRQNGGPVQSAPPRQQQSPGQSRLVQNQSSGQAPRRQAPPANRSGNRRGQSGSNAPDQRGPRR